MAASHAPVAAGGDTITAPAVAASSETVAGAHVLRIDSFSGTKDLGVGEGIESRPFLVGGRRWLVECFPCGYDEDAAGWVSVSLTLEPRRPPRLH
ncbi:hypothetical protein ACP70R_007698 [Stipagrostis hirtigluma subsp. patula]